MTATPTAARQHNVIQIESRSSVELELTDLVADGRFAVFPHVEQKGLLFLQFKKDRVSLSAGAYIGLIPLTPTITIDVKPKLPVSSLSRVLDVAAGSLSTLTGFDRAYLDSAEASTSVLEFLCYNLVQSIEPILVNGLHKTYVPQGESSERPRGTIDMIDTVRQHWSRAQLNLIKSHRFDQTTNIPPNRVIKSALEVILQRLNDAGRASGQLARSANSAYLSLPSSIGPFEKGDDDRSRLLVLNKGLPEWRNYYYRALDLALFVLSERQVSIEKAGSDVVMNSFIVNFDDIFEAYIRRVLQSRCGANFWVKDGNKEGRKPLFDDRKEPPAQPDILLTEAATRNTLVAEVKYKDKPNRDDVNQAITYAVSYRSEVAVLIHQARPGQISGIQKIGTVNGIRLFAYGFDLGNSNLDTEEAVLAREMCDLTTRASAHLS